MLHEPGNNQNNGLCCVLHEPSNNEHGLKLMTIVSLWAQKCHKVAINEQLLYSSAILETTSVIFQYPFMHIK